MNNNLLASWKGWLFLILVLPVLIPVLLCYGILHLLYKFILYILVWLIWSTRGIRLLLVYSNSPNWETHIEDELLPKITAGKVILNWSERGLWETISLRTALFFHFRGSKNFNPMAIVFKPFHRIKVIRFHEAFLDAKHGKTESLRKLEAELLESLR